MPRSLLLTRSPGLLHGLQNRLSIHLERAKKLGGRRSSDHCCSCRTGWRRLSTRDHARGHHVKLTKLERPWAFVRVSALWVWLGRKTSRSAGQSGLPLSLPLRCESSIAVPTCPACPACPAGQSGVPLSHSLPLGGATGTPPIGGTEYCPEWGSSASPVAEAGNGTDHDENDTERATAQDSEHASLAALAVEGGHRYVPFRHGCWWRWWRWRWWRWSRWRWWR